MKHIHCSKCVDEDQQQYITATLTDDDKTLYLHCLNHPRHPLLVAKFAVTLTEEQKMIAERCAECGEFFEEGKQHVH